MYKGVSEKYKQLVTLERVADRIQFLRQVGELVEKAALPEGMAIRLCGVRLTNVVYSYFYDKERHSDFHGHNGGPSDPKKLAFMVKWIAKIKPFSVVFESGATIKKEDQYYFQNMINPIFCSILARVVLRDRFSMDTASDEHLMYTLHYGDYSYNMLIALYEKA